MYFVQLRFSKGVGCVFQDIEEGNILLIFPSSLYFSLKDPIPWKFSPLILRQGDISVAAPDYTYFFLLFPLDNIFQGSVSVGSGCMTL